MNDRCAIHLGDGRQCYVSFEDYEYLVQFNWVAHHDGKGKYYVCRYEYTAGKRTRIYMHREITNCKKGLVVDHIDCDTFNNHRSNLRVCTKAANKRNCVPWGKLLLKGVSVSGAKFRARIYIDDNDTTSAKHLGTFASAEEAARAYDAAAKKYFGEFAWVNFPEPYTPKAREPEYEIPF